MLHFIMHSLSNFLLCYEITIFKVSIAIPTIPSQISIISNFFPQLSFFTIHSLFLILFSIQSITSLY
jgi:hypothetical protein